MADSSEFRVLLYGQAQAAWRDILRPWFQDTSVGLARSYVVVATRGQTYGLKLQCLAAGVPLLGVEFLTPGLARKKWLPLHVAEQGGPPRPAAGREILLLGLSVLIEQRLTSLSSQDPIWGFWKSLQSDPERVLDDFDELLKAGFRSQHFGLVPLQEIMGELTAWVARLGYGFAPLQSEAAALTLLPADARKLGGRLLIYGLSAELWPEFSNVAALARRFSRVTVALPEPEFRGRKHHDESWIELWEALLGAPAEAVESSSDISTCAAVGQFWKSGAGERSAADPLPARVAVGCTRHDEMALVADEIAAALTKGAEHVGVVFPTADATHGVLKRLLQERGIPFHDAIEGAGTSSIETQVQRGLLLFYQRGARLEDLLELWPLLKTIGRTAIPAGAARDVCERLFDEKQTHALAVYAQRLDGADRPEWQEVAKIARLLLPPFPREIAIADAIRRFSQLCDVFGVSVPPNLAALAVVGERERRELPSSAVLAALLSFVPEGSALLRPENGSFARVTLLTRRRAEGLSFSHLILTEANAGVWPRRSEPSPWLSDEHKERLNPSSRFSLGLFTAEDRASLEKQSYCALARDSETEVIFTAALFDEAQPETRLAPNSWVERVLWSDARLREAECDLEEIFGRLAVSVDPVQPERPDDTSRWLEAWQGRRDPRRPFDEHFLSVDPRQIRPDVLSARLLERALQDPAELWFNAVLKASRIEWKPLVRARKRTLGQWVHRVLASSLQTPPVEGVFGEKLELPHAQQRLVAELGHIRSNWPDNQYWDSFHLELSRACANLLAAVYAVPSGRFVATELPLPWKASVPIGNGERLRVRGRVDLAWFDRTQWDAANVDIVDFKTGTDAALSPQRMANDGFALQLGVYLSAAQSLGAASGRVWMLKPELNGFSSLEMSDLPSALVGLHRIGRHLRTGIYGALTPDASEYAKASFVWPIACVPIAEETLLAKFGLTFAGVAGEVPLE